MRLTQYITESSEEIDFDEINNLIHKNCKQYLKLLGNRNHPMLRGMNGQHHTGIKDVRKDREPFGMSQEEANYLNSWLQENGHARRDKSVICTSDDEHVTTFGTPHYIFPLDPIHKYTWLHSPDANLDGDAGWEWKTLMAWMRDQQGKATDVQKNTLSRLKMPFADFFVTNKEFNYAYDHGYEMWFDCNKYYFVYAQKWDYTKQKVFT